MPIAAKTLLAALPILAILVLMLGLRWSAVRAGSTGLLLSLIIATGVFGYGTTVLPELGIAGATGGGLLEATFIAITILWIVFPALCIHELQQASGAIERLRDAIGSLSADPRITAMMLAWFFSLFMEGAAGFGTAAALTAPFLVSMGLGKVEAVTIVLIGHSIGVSFGAVGTPLIPLAAVAPLSALELSASVALYHAVLGLLMALVTMWLIQRALPVHRGNGIWMWAVAAGGLFLTPYYLIAANLGPELPTLGGALLGASAFIVLLLAARKPGSTAPIVTSTHTQGSLWIAGAPYLVLTALIVLTRLIPPLQQTLSTQLLQWRFSEFGGQMAYLYHPGTLLLLSFFIGAWCQRGMIQHSKLDDSDLAAAIKAAMTRAMKRLAPVALALLVMLGLSRIMVHAGMIETLAISAAASAASAWPVFAPFIGVLGAFVTGSATASNILFTEFQLSSAERLGLSVSTLLGAQGFGAAVGNMVAPHNVIAACATVGLAGKEGDVLRRTIPVMLIYTLLGGLLALYRS
ncbi:MAG: L-lactate permease [Gammaproteobacteria bacterium]|nr:L-lactate permease [Gammaproteobacteria bacterium]MDP2140557.1 L-lactate permease [Gammaproteobacteria bacterium]MDP2347326.1 L-lactate permease [Gammaproteobacteria bacterium]